MKTIRVVIILLFGLAIFIGAYPFNNKPEYHSIDYSWNGGYCECDGGRLDFVSVGSKYHYKCNICGKEYIFDSVQVYSQ